MPTGYTAKLYEGEEQTFEDFALSCARAFGAAILMRDDDSSKPMTIEALTDDSDYHVKSIRHAKAELIRLKGLTPEEVASETHNAYLERVEFEERYKSERLAMRARYEAMLEKVRAWEPPSEEHVEFRMFMINQLEGSIDFDTSGADKQRDPEQQTPEQWLADRIAHQEKTIERSTEEEAKRIERNEGRIRWVNQLRESVGLEALTPA